MPKWKNAQIASCTCGDGMLTGSLGDPCREDNRRVHLNNREYARAPGGWDTTTCAPCGKQSSKEIIRCHRCGSLCCGASRFTLHSKSSWSVDIDGHQQCRPPSRNTRRCGKVAQEEHPRCPKQQSLRHILGCARLAGDKPSLEAGVRRAWLGTGDCQKERACRSADPWRGNDKSRLGRLGYGEMVGQAKPLKCGQGGR